MKNGYLQRSQNVVNKNDKSRHYACQDIHRHCERSEAIPFFNFKLQITKLCRRFYVGISHKQSFVATNCEFRSENFLRNDNGFADNVR